MTTGNRWQPLSNWRSNDLPFPAKLRAALRNNWIKLHHRRPCCGNHGEPGCCRGSGRAAGPEAGPHPH